MSWLTTGPVSVRLIHADKARDAQGWEMVPLGPFMGKSFVTTISPWVVMPEALAPAAAVSIHDNGYLLPHLRSPVDKPSLDISFSISLRGSSFFEFLIDYFR